MAKSPDKKHPIAYFCIEFAIDNDLPTYAGGLGVLAGDLILHAAKQDFPMVGVGILYKGSQFIQHITGDGKEEKRDSEFDHDTSFLRPTTKGGKPLIFKLQLENTEVEVKTYQIRLSEHTTLYLLSTDVDGNPPDWVSDMDAVYKGDSESQVRQQILLGVGGVKLLNTLSIKPFLYHINEGRPGFIIWEIVSELMKRENIPFEKAWQKAKEKIVYTNHTLIAAGNLVYDAEIIKKWAALFAKNLGVETNLLIKEGLNNGAFSITQFALNISKKHSCVSEVHSKYAGGEWPNYDWIPITNGINMERWQDSDFRKGALSDKAQWELHMAKKRELMKTVIKRTGFGYDPNRLVISWARRLAEYKQPKAIFADIVRLKKMLSNAERPIQLLFAGNSHSADPSAKSIIEEIIKIFSSELSGHAIFIPNYNITLANHITSGSDVWLNTPRGNLEACGTSGMKAISNGVLNCTVLDGWTYEADWKGIGWELNPDNVGVSFYELLEKEITPLYYARGNDGLPHGWIERMKKSIEVSKTFSCERMFEEYIEKLYTCSTPT